MGKDKHRGVYYHTKRTTIRELSPQLGKSPQKKSQKNWNL